VSPEPDNDAYYDSTHVDKMTASPLEVLTVITVDEPVSPWQFIFDFKARYPQYTEQLWETCLNNGLSGIDTTAPVTGALTSTSHPEWSTRSDNTIGIKVVDSTDDFSGVQGHCLAWSLDDPVAPGYVINRPNTLNAIQTDPVAPGVYYLTVRTVDNAGHWTEGFSTFGPVAVRDPIPSDLRPEPLTEYWDYPLMPKDTSVASEFEISADTDLLSSNTYWNACVTNDGEVAVSSHASSVFLDGVEVGSFDDAIPAWGDHDHVYNQGPLTIKGGRHTFELAADFGEIVAEPDEGNNTWGKQWIWQPQFLSPNALWGLAAPPDRTGGWASVDDLVKWYNCYGFRFNTLTGSVPSTWTAVWIKSGDGYGDLDIRLHDQDNGATSGFADNLCFSDRPAGCIDAVLVNAANRMATSYDAGVITTAGDIPETFNIQAAYGASLTAGAVRAGVLSSAEGLDLFTFQASPSKNYTVFLTHNGLNANQGPIWLTWYDQDFSTGALMQYDGIAVTDSTNSLSFTFDTQLTLQNVHGFAVWRDPTQNTYRNQDYLITVMETPPDLATNQPSQWAAPMVPRPDNDATTVWAPEPANLSEYIFTYVNYSLSNDSLIPASEAFGVSVVVDGVPSETRYYFSLGAGAVSTYRPTVGQIIRGGRHTLAVDIDPSDGVVEFSESNNSYATQYVWKPAFLPFDTRVTRAEPPERTGGWSLLDSEEVHWFNCDAQRPGTWDPSGSNGYWGAVAILPGATTDLDLDLHNRTLNPRHSFEAPLASSQWSTGQSDFVLMNFHNTTTREYDLGIVQAGEPTGNSYKIITASSVGLPADPDGGLGTFNMGSSDIIQLYEIDFTVADAYHAQMVLSNPSLSLGFSLYGPSLVHGGKSDVLSETAAGWAYDGSGVYDFDFTVMPGETGKHCLAVWKTVSSLVQTSDYTLNITAENVSAVDTPELPAATRLTATYPNPFNPRTTIDFSLAEKAQARVTIHDLMGRRVATLVDANLAAGRHSVSWQGQDESGRRVASGTYFVQFRAGDVRETKKLMLVK